MFCAKIFIKGRNSDADSSFGYIAQARASVPTEEFLAPQSMSPHVHSCSHFHSEREEEGAESLDLVCWNNLDIALVPS